MAFLQKIFSSWRSSTLQLIAAIVIPLTLLLVAISFASYFIHQNAMRTMVGERDERAARASAAIIQSEIQRRIDFVRGLAIFSAQNDLDVLEHARQQSDYGSELFDHGLALSQSTEELQVLSGDKSFWDGTRLQGDQPLVSMLIQDDRSIVLISYTSPETGNTALGAFSPGRLLKNALENDFPARGNAAVYVFDLSFRSLYHSGQAVLEGDPAHHPGIMEALAGKSGTTYVKTESGDEHVLAYSFVPATGWAIVIEESWEAVASPTLQTTQITPLILVPALLLALLALWFGAEQIVKPLRSLEAKAARLAWGDFQEIEKPVAGIAEIRHLQNELVHMVRQVQAAQQGLRNYISAITRGQEEERQRLARELHDDTIQALIALRQRAQLTRRALPKDASLPALGELETLTEETIQNLRRTIRALRPIYLEDFGLATALEILAKETAQASGMEVEFQKVSVERRLAPEVELAFYRMAQEALNNTLQHAGASQALLTIEFNPRAVSLHLSDNGTGFTVPQSPAEFSPAGHFGLLGLHERAQLIGARLEIDSAPGKGTRITITLQDKH